MAAPAIGDLSGLAPLQSRAAQPFVDIAHLVASLQRDADSPAGDGLEVVADGDVRRFRLRNCAPGALHGGVVIANAPMPFRGARRPRDEAFIPVAGDLPGGDAEVMGAVAEGALFAPAAKGRLAR